MNSLIEKTVMAGVCVACLASNRRLQTLNKTGNYLTFVNLLSTTEASTYLRPDHEICWECFAQLRYLNKFRNKAVSSLCILKSLQGSVNAKKPQCFSQLTFCEAFSINVTEDVKVEEFDEAMVKEEHETSKSYEEIFIETLQNDKTEIQSDIVFDSDATLTADECDNEDNKEFDSRDYDSDSKLSDVKLSENKKNNRKVSKKRKKRKRVTFKNIKNNKVTKATKVVKLKTEKTHRVVENELNEILQSERNLCPELPKLLPKDDDDKTYLQEDKLSLADLLKARPKEPPEIKPLRPIVTSLKPSWTMQTLSDKELSDYIRGEKGKEVFSGRPYKCEGCVVSFWCNPDLETHNEKFHSQAIGSFTCDICQCRFNLKKEMLDHRILHYVLYNCSQCEYNTQLISRITRHYDNKHVTKGYFCQYCNENFDTYTRRRTHYDIAHKKTHRCTRCKTTFATVTEFNRHYRTEHAQTKCEVHCTMCKKVFKSMLQLKHHMRSVHVEKKSVYCSLCNKFYRDEKYYKVHLTNNRKHITPDQMKYQCEHCARRFMSERYVERHIKAVHLKKSDHQCSKCDKSYSTMGGLLRHVSVVHDRTFVKQRDKICDLCGRGFGSDAILTSHRRTHTGEKPFECVLCPFKTAHKGALYTHKKLVHEKVKRIWPKKKKIDY